MFLAFNAIKLHGRLGSGRLFEFQRLFYDKKTEKKQTMFYGYVLLPITTQIIQLSGLRVTRGGIKMYATVVNFR